jgi:hypothetical protein
MFTKNPLKFPAVCVHRLIKIKEMFTKNPLKFPAVCVHRLIKIKEMFTLSRHLSLSYFENCGKCMQVYFRSNCSSLKIQADGTRLLRSLGTIILKRH